MDWLRNEAAVLIWVGVAIAAGLVEVLTLDLIFLMVAGAAFVTALTALLGLPPALQVVVFAASTALLLFAARPPLLRYMRRNLPSTPMNIAALEGQQAEVLSEVTLNGGRVKLAGEVWSARAQEHGDPLEIGSRVHVLRIDGATAVVTPLPPRAALPGADPSAGPDPAV